MPKNIHVALDSFKGEKKYTFGGKDYIVKFVQNPTGNGFVAYDVPDVVAGHLLSGKFPAFTEHKVGKPVPEERKFTPPVVDDVEEEKPKPRRKVSG